MTVPTVTSVTPNRGRTIGRTLVRIVGSDFNLPSDTESLKVFFGTEEAEEVKTLTSSLIHCLTPRGIADLIVSVVVENTTLPGPVVEPGTLPNAYTFKRSSIATPPDYSNHCNVALVMKFLTDDMRNGVIQNIHHDMHPEYSDDVNSALRQENQAKVPSIKLVGPDLENDRFFAKNGRQCEEKSGNLFDTYDDADYVKLIIRVVGVGETKGQCMNLYTSLNDYLRSRFYLPVFANGVDDSDGVVPFEMSTDWNEKGNFTSPGNREGFFQFSKAIMIRGVPVKSNIIEEDHKTTEDVQCITEQI